MDSKKLSLVVTLATSTALLLIGAGTFEGVNYYYTHDFNLSNLKTRIKFNNFLKSDYANREETDDSEDFYAVRDFVKNNGKGSLVATEDKNKKYFEFNYYEDSEPDLSQSKALYNWQAVDQYLKDIEKVYKLRK